MHVIVPKADDPKSFALKILSAHVIPMLSEGVLPSIQFNDHPLRHADEINDVASNWMLAAKLESLKTPTA